MSDSRLRVVALLDAFVRRMLGDEGLARLRAAHARIEVEIVDPGAASLALLREADGAVLHTPAAVRLLAEGLARGPGARLRWVHWAPNGAEGLLAPEVVAAGQAGRLVLTSSKGPMADSVAEHALALLLALARGLPAYHGYQAERRWAPPPPATPPTTELRGRTIAILGVGEIGGRLARMCQAGLGMRVLGLTRVRRACPYVDRYFGPGDLPGALAEADAVAVTLPATAATERLVGAAALAALRPTAFLVNVARGALVDEPALVAALRAGRLAGAALDVFETEPLPPDHPLWTLPNVIVTPHKAQGTDRLVQHLTDFLCDALRRFAEGEPLRGVVDPHAGY
jgi:D-2-hydroxyacid dehydrogenase (NADP+)